MYAAQHVGFNMSPPAYLSLTPRTSLDLLRGRVGANYASGGSGILDLTVCYSICLQIYADLHVRSTCQYELQDPTLTANLNHTSYAAKNY